MLSPKDKLIGMMLVALVLPIAALSYYFSFRSGCLFDGKQGYGDIHAASVFSWYSLLASLAALVSYSFGVYRLSQRNANKTAAMLLLSLTLGLPALFWLSFEGEIHGTQTCSPS